MVMFHTLQDILDTLPQAESFSLPTFKQNPFKLEFTKDVSFVALFLCFKYLTSVNKCCCTVLQSTETRYHGKEPILPFASSEVYHACVSTWRRLTALEGDSKAVYEVTFAVEVCVLNIYIHKLTPSSQFIIKLLKTFTCLGCTLNML